MKAFLKILVVALVATAPQLVGCSRAPSGNDVGTGNLPPAQAQVKADEASVPVALPELGEVFLKGGDKISGRVTEIDSQTQKLSVQRQNSTTSVSLSQVDRVAFSKNALVHETDGRQFIRGDGVAGDGVAAAGIQETWSGVPFP